MTTRRGGSGRDLGAAPAAADAAEDAAGDGDAGRGDDEPRLRAMRTVWLAMRDEAPPARGMAELLAAARRKAEDMAEAMQPTPTRWQRLLAALRGPPGLALATAMVLIGGGVLIGRRVGEPTSGSARLAGEGVARPRGSTTEEPGDRARAATSGPGHGVSASPAVGAVSAEPSAATGGSGSRAAVEPAELRRAPGQEATTAPAVHTARPTRTTVDRPEPPRMEPAGQRPPAAPAPTVPSTPRSKDDDVGTREAAARDLQKTAAERVSVLRGSPSPPPHALHRAAGSGGPTGDEPMAVADSAVADHGNNGGESAEDAKAAHLRGQSSATPSPLYEQCESAARRGDCAAVRRIVDQITRRDRGYRDRIARGSAVGKCLVE